MSEWMRDSLIAAGLSVCAAVIGPLAIFLIYGVSYR